MKTVYYFFVLSLFILSCENKEVEDPECTTTPVFVDHGYLSDSILDAVPYKYISRLYFKHSAGKIIKYNYTNGNLYRNESNCECCDTIKKYQNSILDYQPDYATFSLKIQTSNYYIQKGEINIYLGNSYNHFIIPAPWENNTNYSSVNMNGNTFEKVYKLKNIYAGYVYDKAIYPDSLYYNYRYGILKIIMNNNEYYDAVF